jgi:3-deoxy-D-manno-octulosonic-acid transferase
MLSCYAHVFVQDSSSRELLASIGIKDNVTAAGDTRYDRVAAIAALAQDFPVAEAWKGACKVFIAGSTWKDDEQLLKSALNYMPSDWKMILAPHEIHEVHLQEIEALFSGMTVRYSQLKDPVGSGSRVLLIDNIGMLSSLYRLGDMAFVGGGFGSGIHNILEPAVYGLPVFFGPNYKRFIEARTMVDKNLAFSISNENELKQQLVKLYSDMADLQKLSSEIKHFVQMQLGATDKVLAFLYQILPLEKAG